MNSNEIEVLKILWESDKPLTLSEIVTSRPTMIKSSVATILSKLLKQNLIKVAGTTYSGKVLSRTYIPTPSSKEAIIREITNSYRNVSGFISQSALFASLLGTNKTNSISSEELTKLKTLLDNLE